MRHPLAAALEKPEPAVEHLRNVETVLVAELQLTTFAGAGAQEIQRFRVRVGRLRAQLEQGKPARVELLVAAIGRAIARGRLDAAAVELLEAVLPRLEKATFTA